MANNQSKPYSTFQTVIERHKDSFYPALRSLSELELSTIIQHFRDDYTEQLRDVDLKILKRGALLAQDPHNLSPPEQTKSNSKAANGTLLSAEDKILTYLEAEALGREKRGDLKSLTRGLLITLATCAVGAVVQGWSQQSIVGANLDWPVDLHIATRSRHGIVKFNQPNGQRYFELVNAIPFFAACMIGAWVSDPLTDRYGRRSALFSAGLCSFAAPIGGAYCQKWYWLFVCRFVQGIGMGAKSSVVPILESEVSPPKMRGKLLVSWQTFVGLGIFLGASANCIFEGQWRHQFGIAFVPALPLLCLCYVIPESPRWLIKKGQYGKAYIALRDLRETPLQAARDLYLIHAQLKLEESLFSGLSLTEDEYVATLKNRKQPSRNRVGFFRRLVQLFTIPRNRRAVVGSCVAMAAQQFSGINIYAFLATTVFGNSGIANTKGLWFTFGFALTNAVFSALSFFIIDRLGRRTLILTSLIIMFPFLILTGHFFNIRNDGAVIALVIIYTAFYSPGAGVIPFMYSSEVFPVVHREVGMSLAVSVNLGLAGALAMVVPQFNAQDMLGTFAALDGLAVVLVWLFMRSPEEAVSLEEMNYLFLWPTMSYVRYQCKVALPWAFKQSFWIFGRISHSKPSFEEWNETVRSDLELESVRVAVRH